MAMARRLIILGVILGLIAGPLCAAQPLHVPKVCPIKTRCCRMLPAQPTDAVEPQAPPQITLAHVQPLVVASTPALPAAQAILDAPFREVPTRTIVLRI